MLEWGKMEMGQGRTGGGGAAIGWDDGDDGDGRMRWAFFYPFFFHVAVECWVGEEW